MLAPDEYDGSDTRLCADCDEVVEGWQFHPGCCPHDVVEVDDGRDGEAGAIRAFCQSCGEEVRLGEPEEDGVPGWEVM